MKIRLSPSGPFIENDGGGAFDPGTGSRLRLSEATTTISGSLAIPTAPGATIGTLLNGGTVMIAELLNPKADLNYRCTLLLDVKNDSTNDGGEVDLYIDSSINGGAWVQRAFNIHHMGGGTGAAGDVMNGRQVRVDMVLRSGASLDMTTGDTSLRVRGRVASSSPVVLADSLDTGGATGTALIQLEELF